MNLLEHLFNSYKTWKQERIEAKNMKLYVQLTGKPHPFMSDKYNETHDVIAPVPVPHDSQDRKK